MSADLPSASAAPAPGDRSGYAPAPAAPSQAAPGPDANALQAANDSLAAALGEVEAARQALAAANADLARAERRAHFLAELGQALQPLADPDDLMTTTARLLGQHLGADRCAYAEVQADEDTFTITGNYTRGDTVSIVGRFTFAAFGAEVLGLMRADRPYVVDDAAADPRVTPADRAAYEQTQIQAVVCVPLHKVGRLAAAMAVHQRTPRRWAPDEVALVVTVVQRCWESLERARADRDLRARDTQLRAMVDALPTLAWTAQPDGHVDWFNARWYEYTGTTPADMEGWGWQQVHDPAELPWVLARWRDGIATGQSVEMTFPLRGADGRYRPFLTRIVPVKDREGCVVRWFGTNTDVEAERAAREAAERAAARTAQLQALTAALAGVRTVDDVAAVVVAEVVAAAGASTGMLAVRPPGAEEAVIVRQSGLHPDVVARYTQFPLTAPGPAAACLRTGEPQWAESRAELLALYPDAAAVWEALGTHAVATVPLAVAGVGGAPETVGAMSYTWTAPRALDAGTRAFYLALGRQAAQAIERARLLEAEQAARAAAEESAAFLGAVITTAPLGIAVYDRALRYAHINDVLARSNGRPAAAHLGRTVAEVRPDLAPALVPLLEQVLATGEPLADLAFTDREPAGGPSAAPRCWRVSIYPVHGTASGVTSAGPVLGVGVVAEDVTERERLLAESGAARRAAEEARARADEANRAKSQFLATMSHELRTPLNAIGGYAELLDLGLRGPVTDEQRTDLARIQRAQRHLLGLINGLLNYAKVDAGAVAYAVEAVPLDDALAACEALIAPQVRAKGLSLAHRASDGGPGGRSVVARADREKLEQVVLNLLSNAVKFTDPGGRIALRVAADGAVVTVTVADTGIGIAADQLSRVFEPFVQVDQRLTRTQEGTGLGLAISRDLARGMGGDLTVESTPGVGSTFTLTLPAA